MNDRFWKFIAIAGVAGVFYLGHGLHQQNPAQSFPSLTSTAQADGIVLSNGQIIFTANPAGDQVYAYRATPTGVMFVGTASAEKSPSTPVTPQ